VVSPRPLSSASSSLAQEEAEVAQLDDDDRQRHGSVYVAGRWGDIVQRNCIPVDQTIGISSLDRLPGLRLQTQMELRKKKKVAVHEIEIDLSRIQQLSEQRDEENWEFRSWLKQYTPDDIDDLVGALSQKYFALIDCTQCANCCRTLQLELKRSELHAIAKTLGDSLEAFEKKFMSEGKVNPPCPMLDGNLCSIYERRPEVCRSFPHLEKPGFTFRLIGVIENLSICPIAFNAFEELKATLVWPCR
jgi:uncharacterized protein